MENPANELQNFFDSNNNRLKKEISAEVISAMRQLLIEVLAKQNNDEPVLLKESEVMTRYKCSRSFLYTLRVKNNLPFIKVGDALYFDQKKTSEFFSNHKNR